MRQVYIFVVLLILSSCIASKRSYRTFAGKTLTYTVQNVNPNILSTAEQLASLCDSVGGMDKEDSMQLALAKILRKRLEQERKYPNELYIEVTEDGWIRQRHVRNMYTDFRRHFNDNDSLVIYSRDDKTQVVRRAVFDIDRTIVNRVEKDVKRKKRILGYDCYYLKMIHPMKDTVSHRMVGDIIMEMYVTEKIKLPAVAILGRDYELKGCFPLEVKRYLEKIPENQTLYTLKSIE